MTKRYTMPEGGTIWSDAGGGEEKVVRRMADVGEVLSYCRETGVILGEKGARAGQPMQQCDCAPDECRRGKTAPRGLVTFAQIPLVRLDPAKVKSVGTADHGQRAQITMLLRRTNPETNGDDHGKEDGQARQEGQMHRQVRRQEGLQELLIESGVSQRR